MENAQILELKKEDTGIGGIEYATLAKIIDEYNHMSVEQVQKEMVDIYVTWKHQGLHILAERANISRQVCYQMVKRCVKYKLSFETYVKIKAVGKNVYYTR